jgi:hypothetical protein
MELGDSSFANAEARGDFLLGQLVAIVQGENLSLAFGKSA